MLEQESGVDWAAVELFHLDEYVGIGIDHPASFARYIKERVVIPLGIRKYHLLDGSQNPDQVARTMSAELRTAPVHLAFCGIGENGHLAFNDPPANFEATEPYIVVQLDQACRSQQVGEGWFSLHRRGPETRDYDLNSLAPEDGRTFVRGSRPAQSRGGEGMFGRPSFAYGASFDIAYAPADAHFSG